MRHNITNLTKRPARASVDPPPEQEAIGPSQLSENDICIHIFTVSAAMVGVCLTVIGLFKVIAELKSYSTVGDNLLAIDSLAFLASCMLSYIALRSSRKGRKTVIERVADIIFLAALSLMVMVCGLIAYALI